MNVEEHIAALWKAVATMAGHEKPEDHPHHPDHEAPKPESQPEEKSK